MTREKAVVRQRRGAERGGCVMGTVALFEGRVEEEV